MFFWELPIDQLKAFKLITVLTYMFDASVMHAYFRCYALSELLQWIFRSAIREQKDLKLYLPSKRMHKLLHEWSGGLCKV